MNQIVIMCVEDEPEVRAALVRDLAHFASVFRIEEAEDAEDARQALEACLAEGDVIGLLLCDHVLPGQFGVDLLVELRADERLAGARVVLVTGQAGLEATIKAVNDADLDHYLAKPWTREELHAVVRAQLTAFVIDRMENVLPYVGILDSAGLLEVHKERASDEE